MPQAITQRYLEPPRPWPEKFELLDGFRGIAASGVVLQHLHIADIGHYCVMMFFVISGYCITASAASGLRKGMATRTFIYNRIRRIYPPYVLAVLFFAVTRVARHYLTGEAWSPSLAAWAQNLTLTQWLTLFFHPMAEAPQNPVLFVTAFWSLNYEIQFYVVMAVGLVLLKRVGLPLVYFVAALTLAGMMLNLGWPTLAVRGLFIEYWAHFGLGAGLYFLLCGNVQAPWLAITRAALVVLMLFVAWRLLGFTGPEFAGQQHIYSEYVISAGTVLLMLLLRPYDARLARNLLWRPIAAVGTISYSLYLVHQFNLNVVAKIASVVIPPALSSPANLALQFALHLVVGTAFWACCERPFQRASGPPKRDRPAGGGSVATVEGR